MRLYQQFDGCHEQKKTGDETNDLIRDVSEYN